MHLYARISRLKETKGEKERQRGDEREIEREREERQGEKGEGYRVFLLFLYHVVFSACIFIRALFNQKRWME